MTDRDRLMSERVAGRQRGFSGFVTVKRLGDTEIRVKVTPC